MVRCRVRGCISAAADPSAKRIRLAAPSSRLGKTGSASRPSRRSMPRAHVIKRQAAPSQAMAAALRSIRCYSPRLDFRPVAFFQLQGYALNESGVEGITREPRSLMDAKFVHEALTMLLDGLDADAKLPGCLFVGKAFGDELQHLTLAGG